MADIPEKDVSMVDVSTINSDSAHMRRPALILTENGDKPGQKIDGNDGNGMHIDQSNRHLEELQVQFLQGEQYGLSQSQPNPGYQQYPNQQSEQDPAQLDSIITIPVHIKWVQGGEKVYVTGSFTGWRKMIGLTKKEDNTFEITLGLPIGTHRFRFVIDNELRFSDFLPTATDQMGNFVNYVEVTYEAVQSHVDLLNQEHQNKDIDPLHVEEQAQMPSRKALISRSTTRTNSMWGLTNDDDDMGNGYSRYHDEAQNGELSIEYITTIPPIFTDAKVMEQYYIAVDKQSKSQGGPQQAWLHPPQLPPHLDNVILNSFKSVDNNSGALPIPNHVVLNHLATTSIKHNTLAVASVVRYNRKYVTQVLYAPLG